LALNAENNSSRSVLKAEFCCYLSGVNHQLQQHHLQNKSLFQLASIPLGLYQAIILQPGPFNELKSLGMQHEKTSSGQLQRDRLA